MVMNGAVGQNCSTVVDRARMFESLIRIRVPIDGTHDLGPGPVETPRKQDTRYHLSRCMTCGCCLEACPQFTIDNDFIGAAAIGQTRYFNEHETGSSLQHERLDVLEESGGIFDCGNAQNCVKVCPKDIPLTEAIAAIGRRLSTRCGNSSRADESKEIRRSRDRGHQSMCPLTSRTAADGPPFITKILIPPFTLIRNNFRCSPIRTGLTRCQAGQPDI